MTTGVNEAAVGLEWLYQTLSADTTLAGYCPGGVVLDMAPPETATPFVVITLQSATDTVTASGVRLLAVPLYQVKAVGPQPQYSSALAPAADRIDALLGRVQASQSWGGASYAITCYRDGIISQPELVAGASGNELWNNVGGFYRLTISVS